MMMFCPFACHRIHFELFGSNRQMSSYSVCCTHSGRCQSPQSNRPTDIYLKKKNETKQNDTSLSTQQYANNTTEPNKQHLLPAERLAKQQKRNGNGDRLACGRHGGCHRSAARAHQRQHKLYAQIARQTKQERIAVRLNRILGEPRRTNDDDDALFIAHLFGCSRHVASKIVAFAQAA